jgi:NAD(P)-dependent dehydrogenase (short-subunit alcohol dehydrogenase family)
MTVARASPPHLRAQGGGHLMQVSSEGGLAAWPFLSVYNTTKWGIEGFYESMSQELAPLGIATTLIEPGAARTNSSTTSVEAAPALEPYAELRAKLLASFGEPIGDPVKIARAIIAAADAERPPRRLVLGSDAYVHVQAALTTRLREVEAQRESARRTDAA